MPGRNELCLCGSGKKYKHCCLRAAGTDDPTARFNRGVALLELGRFEAAQSCFRLALQLDPKMAPAHCNLGIALKRLGRLGEAESAYRRALELLPVYAPAHHNLGELLLQQGRSDAARRCFEQALAIDAQMHPSRLNLGNLLADLGELEAAMEHFRLLIRWQPRLSGAYVSLGSALCMAERFEEALQNFTIASVLTPQAPQAHFNVGKAALQNHDYPLASAAFNKVLDLQPDFPAAELHLAAVMWCQGLLHDAVARMSPDCSPTRAYYLLGTCLMSCGLATQALECFERVLEIDPTQPTAVHFAAALRGNNPDHAHARYVQAVFDDCAATFDRDLVGSLQYTAPRELARMANEFGTRAPPWDVLDLGCGTGLFGAAVTAPVAAEVAVESGIARTAARPRLVGIDLSANMLERARALGIYARLEHADLLSVLETEAAQSFDLIAAADVLIYVGKTDGIAAHAARLLRPGGLFVFSAEAEVASTANQPGAAGYRLSATGRYVHTLEYLDRLARSNGFQIRCSKPWTLRLEQAKPVAGWLVAWQL